MDEGHPLTFGSCALDLRARELSRGGELVAVEPKVFDLIALLATQRGAVTKDEIFSRLWPQRTVTDGALARVVMLARQALGDASLIKTVNRVGYRFTGHMAPGQGRPAGGAARRIALLPIENQTHDPLLAWTELGLPALILQGLEQPGDIDLVGLAELLPTLAGLPQQLAPAERAVMACRLLGLAGCILATLRKQRGMLWLDYRTHGSGVPERSGSVCGSDPVELGLGVARQLREAWLPAGTEPLMEPVQDPFLQQAMARARQLTALHHFRAAAKLWDMVVEFEPHHLPARLAHVQALADVAAPEAVALGEALAAVALARGDRRLQAQALAASGHAQLLAEAPGSLALARDKLDRALAIARPYSQEDWAMRLQAATGRAALLDGDLATARRLMLDMETRSRQAGNDFQLALALDHRAWIEWECGEWLKAHALMDRSIHIFVRHRLQGMAALTMMNRAQSCVELGLLQEAAQQAGAAIQLLDHVQQPHALASFAEAAAQVFAALRAPQPLDALLNRMSMAPQHGAAVQKAGWRIALGFQALLGGRVAEGRAHLMHALAQAQQSVIRRSNRLRRLMEFELAAHEPPALAAACDLALLSLAAHDDATLRLLVRRAEAAQALATGAVDEALALLLPATRLGGASRQLALARLDAAWLLCAVGRFADAQAVSQGLGPWLDEHPLGSRVAQALQAREPLPTLDRLASLA